MSDAVNAAEVVEAPGGAASALQGASVEGAGVTEGGGVEPLADEMALQFLEEAARYFANRDTKGEDRYHWANVYNAENCRRVAATIRALQENLAFAHQTNKALQACVEGETRLRAALEPFGRAATLMNLLGRHDQDVVYMPVIDANFCITAGDLRAAYRALNPTPRSQERTDPATPPAEQSSRRTSASTPPTSTRAGDGEG